MKLVIVTALLCIFCLSATVSALDIEYLGIETRLQKNATALNIITIDFNSSVSQFDLVLDDEISELEIDSKYDTADCDYTYDGKSIIACSLSRASPENRSKLQFSYVTADSIVKTDEGYEFKTTYPVDYFVYRMFTKVYLPEGGSLIDQETNESIFPRYGKVISDGKYIIVYWERENIIEGDDLVFSVSYGVPSGEGSFYDVAVIVVIAVIIIVSLGIFYVKTTHKPTQTLNVVMPLLKGDEKTIVDILTKYEGQVNQKVLVRESDFSKAKVSRIVAGLKERGIIETEHIGRTNKVRLAIKK